MPPGCVGFSSVFDCGVEPYRSHLLNQLNTVMDELAEHSGGIVIDRWDFVGEACKNSLCVGIPLGILSSTNLFCRAHQPACGRRNYGVR